MAASDKASMVQEYPFQRGHLSSVRLYFQHWMWQRQLGYLLHPDIPVGEGTKIADIACGTGIWLLDLAKEHPSAHLNGFDISSAQFPPSDWLPENVTLSNLDILQPIPEFLQETYDVVHVGLVAIVVEKDDPLPVLDNLLALLKPGGYLQWDEADLGGIYVCSPNLQVSCSALDELLRKLQGLMLASKGTQFQWVPKLVDALRGRELTIIGHKYLPIEDDIAAPWTLQHLMAAVEVIQNIDKPLGSAMEWWALYERASEDVQKGASMRMAMVSIVGLKARQ